MNKFVLALALCAVTGFAPAVSAVSPKAPEIPAEENQQPMPEPEVEADCKWVVPHCDSMKQ